MLLIVGCDGRAGTPEGSDADAASTPPDAAAPPSGNDADANATDATEPEPAEPSWTPQALELAPTRGTFVRDEALAAVLPGQDHLIPGRRAPGTPSPLSIERTEAMAFDTDCDGAKELLVWSMLPDSESYRLPSVVRRSADRWGEPERFRRNGPMPPWHTVGRCHTSADIVGDPAPDLLCGDGPLTIVEGRICENGHTAVDWSARHVLEGRSLDEVVGAEASGPGVGVAAPYQALVIDLNMDGRRDVLVSTFLAGSPALLYQADAAGWTLRTDLHRGMRFGAVPWLWREFEEWGVHFMTESGRFEPGDNENAVVVHHAETEAYAFLYASPRGSDDPMGYLGPPREGTTQIGTPMGCGWWQVEPGVLPLYVCSQDNWGWPIFQRSEQGWSLYPVATALGLRPAVPQDRGYSRFLWAMAPTSLRGAPWVQDLVAAEAGASPPGRRGASVPEWADPREGYAGINIWVREADRFRNLGPDIVRWGAFQGLHVSDVDGDARPDLVAGGHGRMPEVWYNRLESVGHTLHIVPRGCGHDCLLEVEDLESGYIHRQQVTNFGNPWTMGPPETFVGVGAATRVRVRLARGVGADVQTADLDASRGTWYVDPGREPYTIP